MNIALKQSVRKKQLVIVETEKYLLSNILYPKHYLHLWLSKKSPRHKFWKPTALNDPKNQPHLCRDRLEYQATRRSMRIDSMLRQRYAYAIGEINGNKRFITIYIGSAYELENGLKIVVCDIIQRKECQIIRYFEILEYSIHNTFYL